MAQILEYVEEDGTEESIIFSVWDYGGQEVFSPLHPLFLTRYGVYVIVFSMVEMADNETNCLSFLRFWLYSAAVHASGPDGDTAPIIIAGTHKDIVPPHTSHSSLLISSLDIITTLLPLCRCHDVLYLLSVP